MIYQCEFINPINLGTEEAPDWNWENIVCEEATTTEIFALIENPEYPEREFFIEKTFTYGDFLFIFLITFGLIFLIGEKIFKFFWNDNVRY